MRILLLIGKEVDEAAVLHLLGDAEVVVARYATVSRGVRRLEDSPADLVLMVPDSVDHSWERAVYRAWDEYETWSVLLTRGTLLPDPDAAGVFDTFPMETVKRENLVRCFRHLKRQVTLEGELRQQKVLMDWVEKTGRLGSWQMDVGGKTTWSDGVRRILGDDGRLSEDFTSVRQFICPEDLEIYDQANKATFEQGWPLDFEYRIRVGEDDIRYLHLHRRVEHGDGGTVDRAYGMLRDVTAEREFENYLFKRDAILQVVGHFAERFLREPDWESGIDSGLEALGKATGVSRVFIFEQKQGQGDDAPSSMTHEWAAPLVKPIIDLPEVQNQTFSPTFDRWKNTLLSHKAVAGHVRNFQSEEKAFFKITQAQSIMIVPVFVGERGWGFIGLSEHREEREWSPSEIESMTMVADIFGAAILRSRMEDLLKEANRSAEEAKVMALEANQAKSRFLANMSHEMRTPISGILGMAEMTITTGLTAEQREHMDMIRDAANSLLSLINDVLDISKIEAAKMELMSEDFDVRSAVETTVRPFAVVADGKSVVFQYTIADDVPARLNGDPDRLAQVLRNLLGNSMKFTERGLVELQVEVHERQVGRTCLLFTVRDTGEGIAPDMLDSIFESFTQADSSVRKRHQGTGLGLTISRELVGLMGGEIGVDSEPGRGSIFSFTAWFGNTTQVADKVKSASAIVHQTMHLNLLLAEDNPLNQKFLTHFLSIFGHTVMVAENGIEVLEILNRRGREIDLVLMDIQMPEMGGIEATQRIRSSDGKNYDPAVPIIALTAYAMKGDKERMFAAGMDDYVSKPVDMKELSAAIARSVAQHPHSWRVPVRPRSISRERQKEGLEKTAVKLDMESLIGRFDGNIDLLKEILDLFLAEAHQKLENLDAAFKNRDLGELGVALHSITNIASHVLAMDVVILSGQLEKQCYHGTLDDLTEGIAELRPQFVALIGAVGDCARTL